MRQRGRNFPLPMSCHTVLNCIELNRFKRGHRNHRCRRSHSDSDYEWLIEVLDGLTDFVRQSEHRGNLTLTKEVKPWVSALLSELFYIVGENARDPLASLGYIRLLTYRRL